MGASYKKENFHNNRIRLLKKVSNLIARGLLGDSPKLDNAKQSFNLFMQLGIVEYKKDLEDMMEFYYDKNNYKFWTHSDFFAMAKRISIVEETLHKAKKIELITSKEHKILLDFILKMVEYRGIIKGVN